MTHRALVVLAGAAALLASCSSGEEAQAVVEVRPDVLVESVREIEQLLVVIPDPLGGGVLEVLEIECRITRQGGVPDAGMHPFAVFVSNCTGEITKKDVEQLEWFGREVMPRFKAQ